MLKPVFAALILTTASFACMAGEDDCFPLCEPLKVTPRAETARAMDDATPAVPAEARADIRICDVPGVRAVEDLNAQIKPIKEIVGYVRSPQGLVMKLVNDHVFPIPAWVGYAIDPVGSLKRRAIDEVRGAAKEMMGMDKERGCVPAEAQPAGTPDAGPPSFAPELPGAREA